MSDNPSGMPAAADNPMAAQQPPAPVASTEGVDVAAVEEALRDVIDPELGINVVDLGLLYGVSIEPDGTVVLDMTLTTAACPPHSHATRSKLNRPMEPQFSAPMITRISDILSITINTTSLHSDLIWTCSGCIMHKRRIF